MEKTSLWKQFKNMMKGDEPHKTEAQAPTKYTHKKPKAMFVTPDFSDPSVVAKLNYGISDYDWKYDAKFEKHVDKIVDEIFENVHDVVLKYTSRVQYKKYSIYADSFFSMCTVTVSTASKEHTMTMSRTQTAKMRFLMKYLEEQKEIKEMKELDDLIGVESEFKSTRLKGGVLKITEEELFASLLSTHPEFFI